MSPTGHHNREPMSTQYSLHEAKNGRVYKEAPVEYRATKSLDTSILGQSRNLVNNNNITSVAVATNPYQRTNNDTESKSSQHTQDQHSQGYYTGYSSGNEEDYTKNDNKDFTYGSAPMAYRYNTDFFETELNQYNNRKLKETKNVILDEKKILKTHYTPTEELVLRIKSKPSTPTDAYLSFYGVRTESDKIQVNLGIINGNNDNLYVPEMRPSRARLITEPYYTSDVVVVETRNNLKNNRSTSTDEKFRWSTTMEKQESMPNLQKIEPYYVTKSMEYPSTNQLQIFNNDTSLYSNFIGVNPQQKAEPNSYFKNEEPKLIEPFKTTKEKLASMPNLAIETALEPFKFESNNFEQSMNLTKPLENRHYNFVLPEHSEQEHGYFEKKTPPPLPHLPYISPVAENRPSVIVKPYISEKLVEPNSGITLPKTIEQFSFGHERPVLQVKTINHYNQVENNNTKISTNKNFENSEDLVDLYKKTRRLSDSSREDPYLKFYGINENIVDIENLFPVETKMGPSSVDRIRREEKVGVEPVSTASTTKKPIINVEEKREPKERPVLVLVKRDEPQKIIKFVEKRSDPEPPARKMNESQPNSLKLGEKRGPEPVVIVRKIQQPQNNFKIEEKMTGPHTIVIARKIEPENNLKFLKKIEPEPIVAKDRKIEPHNMVRIEDKSEPEPVFARKIVKQINDIQVNEKNKPEPISIPRKIEHSKVEDQPISPKLISHVPVPEVVRPLGRREKDIFELVKKPDHRIIENNSETKTEPILDDKVSLSVVY